LHAPLQECYARLANINTVLVNRDKTEHSGKTGTNARETLFFYTKNYKYSKQQG
jgi:hypothetical protein